MVNSFRISRDQPWKGLSQFVDITAGRTYIMSGFVKLLNTVDGEFYHTMQLTLAGLDDQGGYI